MGWGDRNGNKNAAKNTQGAGASGPLGEMMVGRVASRCAGAKFFLRTLHRAQLKKYLGGIKESRPPISVDRRNKGRIGDHANGDHPITYSIFKERNNLRFDRNPCEAWVSVYRWGGEIIDG